MEVVRPVCFFCCFCLFFSQHLKYFNFVSGTAGVFLKFVMETFKEYQTFERERLVFSVKSLSLDKNTLNRGIFFLQTIILHQEPQEFVLTKKKPHI